MHSTGGRSEKFGVQTVIEGLNISAKYCYPYHPSSAGSDAHDINVLSHMKVAVHKKNFH